jgi:anti-sigma regulatory factor (Ser/Thr protein kinase)
MGVATRAERICSAHIVHFYRDDKDCVESVFAHVADRVGVSPVVVIATPAHVTALRGRIMDGGFDVERLESDGSMLMLDAAETLAALSVDGRPDAVAFDRVIGGLVRSLPRSPGSVCAYGEMVALLWANGDVDGAITLEALWNGLLQQQPIDLLCGYPTAIIDDEQAESVRDVALLHSHVVGAAAGVRVARGEFERDPSAVRAARLFAAQTVSSWDAGSIEEDLALVVSELCTNAIVHAHSDFALTVSSHNDSVRVDVRDQSSAMPTPADASSIAPSGRGLLLVQALADRWGAETDGAGKIVWAEIAVP